MRAWAVVLSLCAAGLAADGARLLAVFPTNTRSHYAMYGKIVDALARRGHHVTVVTHFPMKTPQPNVEELVVAGTLRELKNDVTYAPGIIGAAALNNLEQIFRLCVDACDKVLNAEPVQTLLNSTATFDLVLVEVFGTDCFLPLGERFRAPVVGLLTSVPLPWLNEQIGNPDATAYVPGYMTAYGQQMTLWERLFNTIGVLSAKLLYKFKSEIPSQAIAQRVFGSRALTGYSLVLANSHFSVTGVRPAAPAFVEVGGIHLDTAQVLSEDLKQFLDESRQGVIYWSFGSMLRIETIEPARLAAILRVFAELPHAVVIKMDAAQLGNNLTVPANVYCLDWIPQYKTLCHPNVRLFISHGGLLGVQEAAACGVPLLAAPLFADQALNARAAADRGAARVVALRDVTEAAWRSALADLLGNRAYKDNAMKLRDIFLDRPLPPLETGVYWIEYVLRHKGAAHMRSPALDLPMYQHLLLDVIAISLVAAIFTIYILHSLFRYISTRCFKWKLFRRVSAYRVLRLFFKEKVQ